MRPHRTLHPVTLIGLDLPCLESVPASGAWLASASLPTNLLLTAKGAGAKKRNNRLPDGVDFVRLEITSDDYRQNFPGSYWASVNLHKEFDNKGTLLVASTSTPLAFIDW